MKKSGATIVDSLHATGFRITQPRRAVIDVVTRAHAPLSAHDILLRARKIYPDTGLATVYRTLEMLRKIKHARGVKIDGRNYAHTCAEETLHLHLVCNRCHDITELASKTLSQTMRRQLRTHKFSAEDNAIEVFGLCERCR
jgi:Fur family ferric uptake transcriptional regulator